MTTGFVAVSEFPANEQARWHETEEEEVWGRERGVCWEMRVTRAPDKQLFVLEKNNAGGCE